MTYTHGTFNWVDLVAKDIERIKPFYAELFGWSYDEQPSHGGPPYGIFGLGGQPAAGVAQMSKEMIDGGTPSTWNTYVKTDDIAATEKLITEHGGSLMFDTITIPHTGKTNWAKDPEGAVFALWEPMGHHGSGVVNVPGSFCWNERATRDLDRFEKFYGAVFGWTFEREAGVGTSMIHNPTGREQGHALLMNDKWGASCPPTWSVYFAVADCDQTADRAKALGGSVPEPPFDMKVGRVAVLSDPDGAAFYIIQLNERPA
jgi:uncharacterized protein